MQSKSILPDRIKKLHEKLEKLSVDAFLIENPIDINYLTGIKVSSGLVIVHSKQAQLFVDPRYIESAQKKASIPTALLNEENQIAFLKKLKVKKIAFDSAYMRYADYLTLKKFVKKISCTLTPSPVLLKEARSCKDFTELQALERSAKICWSAFTSIQKLFKEGITESELAAAFKISALKNRAENCSFEPIIAFGKNSALPHHRAGATKLKKNDIILMDLGVIFENYCSDMTRVKFFGVPDPKLLRIYKVVRRAHAAALALCRPGVQIKELDLAARREMAKEDFESYFVHSLGHGLGLEIHEFPRISHKGADKEEILAEGMAITIEPGLYLPEKGGVRYEDTIIITRDGYKNLYPEKDL